MRFVMCFLFRDECDPYSADQQYQRETSLCWIKVCNSIDAKIINTLETVYSGKTCAYIVYTSSNYMTYDERTVTNSIHIHSVSFSLSILNIQWSYKLLNQLV